MCVGRVLETLHLLLQGVERLSSSGKVSEWVGNRAQTKPHATDRHTINDQNSYIHFVIFQNIIQLMF